MAWRTTFCAAKTTSPFCSRYSVTSCDLRILMDQPTANLDVYGRSCAYTGPVRIIHGDQDEIAPIAYARRYLDHSRGTVKSHFVV
jgi:pimeloyl-ACP methyl ester carboxylesterase